MEVSRESLAQRYADLVDAELLRRLRSNALTDLAREVALAELTARGVSPDAPIASDGPAIPDEIDFAPDEFERNPYQAPRVTAVAAATQVAPVPRFGLWDGAWFFYVAVIALLAMSSVVFDPDRFNTESVLDYAATGLALIGIVGWRLRRAWLHPAAWVACIAFNLALHAVQLKQAWNLLAEPGASDLLALILASMAIAVVLTLPLFWGLLRYAFASPSIWRERRGGQTSRA